MTDIAREYMDKGTGEQRALFERLHNLIMGVYPAAENSISYGLLKYAADKRHVWLGFRKDGISLYTQFIPLITAFREKHPHLKYGKGCINFRLKDVIPEEDVRSLIESVLQI
jgi:uncharacterized protein YdhG (YjbR/CyaY superfamily)